MMSAGSFSIQRLGCPQLYVHVVGTAAVSPLVNCLYLLRVSFIERFHHNAL